MKDVASKVMGLAVALSLTVSAHGQSPTEAALEREKIGRIAKVAVSVEAPESGLILRDGLGDASARVRAAAARVGHAIGARGLVPDLRAALAKETDPEAARELAWGVAELETTDASHSVLLTASRNATFGREVARHVAIGSRGIEGRDTLLVAIDASGVPSTVTDQVMRTPDDYPSEFLESVLRITKCGGARDAFEVIDIEFRPGGRPKTLAKLRSDPTSTNCNRALEILAFTALSKGEASVRLVLPDQPEFLACVADPEGERASPSTRKSEPMLVTGSIKEPRKIKNRAPRYPDSAKIAGRQGIVILEATISTNGCVRGIRRLSGVTPSLDVSAINAVAAWAYTPTFIDTVPVPVTMTVTVNFRLN
jgi:TonB family protein